MALNALYFGRQTFDRCPAQRHPTPLEARPGSQLYPEADETAVFSLLAPEYWNDRTELISFGEASFQVTAQSGCQYGQVVATCG
jgi:hypothetical protein